YPPETSADGFLPYYASRLATVEINNTFYRFPSAKALEGWASQVPDAFTFALKAPGRITHQRRLKDVGDLVQDLFANLKSMGNKLGPVDFQLAPNFKKDMPRLRDFLAAIPPGAKAAMEFRHLSWFDDEVYAMLKEHGVALVIAESDELEAAGAVKDDLSAPLVATTNWGYLRLRRSDYGDAELRAWGERVRAQAWEEAHVFIKHEAVSSPLLAVRLGELLSG
ncbi:MAG TPA: DUF72 domain-containing protein, partial [Polyangiaceae bacterium]|nr:DUF72 domain-containing protein [Polyangiaceae bacterium]